LVDLAAVTTSGGVYLASEPLGGTGGGNGYPNTTTLTVQDNAALNVGTLSFGNGSRVPGGCSVTVTNNGILNVAGTFNILNTAGSTAGNQSVNLNGGTLAAGNFVASALGSGAHANSLNFNGGTLQANASDNGATPLFLPAIADLTAYVNAGGLPVNPNGYNVTISQPLVHGNGTPDGGLTLIGTGTLTLNAANTYTGNTTITNGTLALGASGSINNSTNITVDAGATFDVSAVSGFSLINNQVLQGNGTVNGAFNTVGTSKIYPGTNGSAGTLTFVNDLTLAANAIVSFDLSTSAGGANDQIVISSGGLNINGNSIHIKAPSTAVGLDTADYVLFNLTGSGAITGSFASAPVWDVQPTNALHYSIVTDPSTYQVRLHYTTSSFPSGMASASPANLSHFQTTLITATLTNGAFGTINSVTVDASQIGVVSPVTLFPAGGNVWTNSVTVDGATALGSQTLTVTFSETDSLTNTAAVAVSVISTNRVWDGGDLALDNWSSVTNWENDLAPGTAGDSVTFAGTTRLTPSLDANYAVTGITFSNNAGSFNLGTPGSTLTLSGGVTNNSANPQIINVPITLNTPQTINAAAGDITLSNTVAGNGGLTKTGNGTLTIGGLENYTNQTTVSGGTVEVGATGSINDSSTANVGVITVGNTAGVNATLNIDGGTVIATSPLNPAMTAGVGAGANGFINMTAGTLTTTVQNDGEFHLGETTNGYGALNLSGGTLTCQTYFAVGNYGYGVFNMTGGNYNQNANFPAIGDWATSGGAGVMNLLGGTFTSTTGTGGGGLDVGARGYGVLNVSGSAAVNLATHGLRLGSITATATGIVNLLGGTITCNVVTKPVAGASATFNFNGGTLQAGNSPATAFMANLNNAYVYSGGAVIDDGGNAITIAQPLLTPTGNGVSSIAVATGGSGYLNQPVVTITGGGGFGAAAVANVSGGAVTSITVVNPGTGYTSAPNVTLFGGGYSTPATVGTVTTAANISGGLTKLNSGTLTLSGANTYTGNTTINAGTLEVVNPVLFTNSTVNVANSAILQLDFAGTNQIGSLVLGGVTNTSGIFNSTTGSPFITGTGTLLVVPPVVGPSGPGKLTNSVSGNILSLSWPAGQGWKLQFQTNSLNAGLGTNWVTVSGSSGLSSTNITMNPALPTVFYRLVYP
jgi:autotransporter-associated beta strand protein